MKLARFFSAVFALCGTVLLAGTLYLCLTNLNAPARMPQVPAGAAECTQQLMDALVDGDYTAAQAFLYGQPQLGTSREPEDAVGALIWDSFSETLTYSFDGSCYSGDSGICRDVTITALNVSAVTEALEERAQVLLDQRIMAAEMTGDMTKVYNAENQLREDVLDQVLSEAALQSLSGSEAAATYQVTLQLVHHNGTWLVVPNDTLLTAVCGGI